MGEASKVAPVDKLSPLLALVIAATSLGLLQQLYEICNRVPNEAASGARLATICA
jgi:hypothetical protein